MNNKILPLILLCIILLLVGIGTKLFIQYGPNEKSAIEQPAIKAQVVTSTPIPTNTPELTPLPIIAVKTTVPTEYSAEALDLDIKRGSFITDDIKQQLVPMVLKRMINHVQVRISKVIRKDMRAFVEICMKSDINPEPLDFGETYLEYPGGKAINNIVHTDIVQIDQARCLVMEFVSIPPSVPSNNWKLTMEKVAFVVPDEGTGCQVYTRRALSSDLLKQNGISFTCNEGSGTQEIKIKSKSNTLTQDQANEMVNRVISGIKDGPWVFNFNAE